MGKYNCTIDLLFDRFRISCMTSDNFCFYLQNRLIQASKLEVNGTVILPPLVFPAQTFFKQADRTDANLGLLNRKSHFRVSGFSSDGQEQRRKRK